MKNILFIMPSLGAGGAEKSLLMLLNMIEEYKSDYKVDLLLFKKEGMFLKQVPEFVNILNQPSSIRNSYSKFSVKNIKKKRDLACAVFRLGGTALTSVVANNNVRAQLRWRYFYSKSIEQLSEEYDIAISYLDGEPMYYLIDKVKAKVKIGWNQNDYRELGFKSKYDYSYFSKLDKIITLTEECKNILKNDFSEYTDKISIIPPLVSPDYIIKCANQFFPTEYEAVTASHIFVSVGRLVEQKGFDLVIEAAKILRSSNLDFKWYIIGDGILHSELNSAIHTNNLNENVYLLGEKENPYPYILNASIFIQSSRYEGKSVILNEAKMLSKPIIVTNYPTVKDQISNECDGLIVDLNSNEIAKSILRILRDNQLRNEMVNYLKLKNREENSIKEEYISLLKL